jgi:DNA-binding beta-propeller fold protein YncE
VGDWAGNNLHTGDNNIYIGNSGNSTESGIIRIGIQGTQTATYLAGTVYANGVALTSDRNTKENFAHINPQEMLAKVAALPVTEWNYKSDSKAKQHIGPMAQDFQAAFGLNGSDDKHISVVDEGGVALAAIQGLNQKLNEKDAEIEALRQSVAELKQMVQTIVEKK